MSFLTGCVGSGVLVIAVLCASLNPAVGIVLAIGGGCWMIARTIGEKK